MSRLLPSGKLPAELLARLLRKYAMTDDRVILGPRVGEDAAVIDFGDRYLIAKTDPITFATDEIGWYAVNVNANDIACTGGAPLWFLATALLPAGQTDAELAESIFSQLAGACRDLGITLIGGHTEITHGIDRPIIVGMMLGETTPDALVRTGGAQPGDVLLLTKGIAVEGVAIIAREKAAELAGTFDAAFIADCQDFLHHPGISVVRDARIVQDHAGVHAMHDPTEGGLATALYEMAAAAGVGLLVEAEQIPILPQTTVLCEMYGLDPLGLIASGALLAALPADEAPRAVAALEAAGILARVIGRVEPADAGVRIRRGGVESTLPTFERDEIARLFE
jgi:hydrogenase expression/formation protein HypE